MEGCSCATSCSGRLTGVQRVHSCRARGGGLEASFTSCWLAAAARAAAGKCAIIVLRAARHSACALAGKMHHMLAVWCAGSAGRSGAGGGGGGAAVGAQAPAQVLQAAHLHVDSLVWLGKCNGGGCEGGCGCERVLD